MSEHNINLSTQDVRRLLATACPEAALLYLYFQNGGEAENAPQALRLSQRQMDYASATLRQIGLFPERPPRCLLPAEAPRYTEADIANEYAANPEFPGLVGEAQRRLGRILSTEELKLLLGIYRYLGLPAEVISILLHYCVEKSRARGAGRPPSLHTIEKEAYRWADLGIDTLEEAAVYMQNQLQLQMRSGRVRQVLQLGERRLTPGEEKLVHTWLSWGFGEEEIRAAYEKTCMNTGGLKWPYLNSILKSWHEQGFTTLRQIEAGDHAPVRKEKTSAQRVQRHDDALTAFERDAIDRLMREETEE